MSNVIDESLEIVQPFSDLREGSLVNIERAAKFGDEIGGHVLSGHIHGLATVIDIGPSGGESCSLGQRARCSFEVCTAQRLRVVEWMFADRW